MADDALAAAQARITELEEERDVVHRALVLLRERIERALRAKGRGGG